MAIIRPGAITRPPGVAMRPTMPTPTRPTVGTAGVNPTRITNGRRFNRGGLTRGNRF